MSTTITDAFARELAAAPARPCPRRLGKDGTPCGAFLDSVLARTGDRVAAYFCPRCRTQFVPAQLETEGVSR